MIWVTGQKDEQLTIIVGRYSDTLRATAGGKVMAVGSWPLDGLYGGAARVLCEVDRVLGAVTVAGCIDVTQLCVGPAATRQSQARVVLDAWPALQSCMMRGQLLSAAR